MADVGEEFDWLKGVTDWYDESPIPGALDRIGQAHTDVNDWMGRTAAAAAAPYFMEGQDPSLGRLDAAATVGQNMANTAASGFLALPRLAGPNGLENYVNSVQHAQQNYGRQPSTPAGQANMAALESAGEPLMAAKVGLGEAGLPYGPAAATAGYMAPDILAMLTGTSALRGKPPRQMNAGELFGKKLDGPTAPDPIPARGPFNPMDPAGKQKGSVRVVDPEADTIKEMFATPRRVVPANISTNPPAGPQGGLFPEAPLIKSVIPEAIDRIANKFGEKPIPAKKLADEIQRMGIKPDELDMYGLTPLLSYGVEEGHEIAAEDLRDAVANKGNELQILTGGEGVNYGPEGQESSLEIDDPEQYAINQNLHRSSSSSHRDRYGDTRQAALFDEKDDQGVAQAAEDFLTFNLIDPDADIPGTGVSGFIRQIQRMPALKPDDMSREEFIVEAGKVFDRQAAAFIGDDYREKMRDPEYGRMEQAWDERKQSFLDSLDRNLYWREQAAGRSPGDNYSEPDVDPSIHTAKGLEGSSYQSDLKAPGSLKDSITQFNFPKAAYGGKDSGQYHFQAPKDYTAMGHLRGSERLAILDDFPYETLSDVPPGTEIPTVLFGDERQYDAHRQAQNPDWDQYNYGRDLLPQEANRMFQLERELDGLRSEAEQYEFYTPERDAADKKIDAVSDEVDKLVGISKGATPDYGYKGRIAQTKLAFKKLMIDAAVSGAEFAGMSTPRMVALSQGSGQGMSYVEDVGWNPDSETWDVGGFSTESVPNVEMKRFFTDEQLAKAKSSIASKEDYKRDYLAFMVSEDADIARSVIQDRDGTELVEETGYKIPLEYYTQPATERKLQRTGFGRGSMFVGPDDIEMAERLIYEAHPEIPIERIRSDIAATAKEIVWDSESESMFDIIGDEYYDLDDYVMQEAEKYVRDDDPDDRSNTASPNVLDTYIDDDQYDYYLNESDAAKLSIDDEVILDESIAGSAANYNDNITLPAIQQIYDELGLGKYDPTYVSTPITDSPVDSLEDYDTVERVPVIPMTPEVVSKTLAGEMTLFGPLNEFKSPAQKRAERNERRLQSPTSLFGQTGADLHPSLEKATKAEGGGLFAPLSPDRLRGLPETAYVPGQGEKKYGNYQPAIDAAERYMESAGLPYTPPAAYAPIDEARARARAHEYDIMKHDPGNPEVKRAYAALIDETIGQYRVLLDSGLEVEFGGYDVYASPREVIDDVIDNNHMYVHPTKDAFGVDTAFDPKDNPLLASTEFTDINGKPMLANDVFRVVHDYFGHIKNGVGFRARGEDAAYQAHASMFSPIARRALASETRGQNSWVNYGPKGEFNKTASAEDTIYADQKTGLMPSWVAEEGRLSATDRRQRYRAARESGTTGFEGAFTDDGRLELVHYSREPISRTDPSRWTEGLSRGVKSEQARKGIAPDRTFFGLEAKAESPYRKEQGLGNHRNVTTVDPELIYDAKKDPDNLWQRPDTLAGTIESIAQNEQRMKDHGYMGYFFNDPRMGKVVAVFDELEVKPYGDKATDTPGNTDLFPAPVAVLSDSGK